ncbi:MAG: glycerol kinase GlpK [Bacilli bacterium]
MEKYILSIDQGTTSSRAILFDHNGNNVCQVQKDLEQIYPQPGWVEHDPIEIWNITREVAVEVVLKYNISFTQVDAIGITNQRETTIIWDKKTGKPIHNAVVWQSKQSQEICDELIAKGKSEFIKGKTGLNINPYFSASKIRWILDHVEGSQQRAEKGELLFGTIETWLIWNLTKGSSHVTDITNASRTLLFNINTMSWDDELLELFNIPKCMLPTVKECSDDFGYADQLLPFTDGKRIPIAGVAGDQQASLFGQCCYQKGKCKNTYGTGCFMLMNIGEKPVFDEHGLLTTIGWKLNGKVTYALEGSVFIAGAAVQWLKDGMKFLTKPKDSEKYAMRVDSCDGVYVIPAFVGLGTPYWDNEARGAMFGITRGTTKDHVIRATLESIAYQAKDLLEAMMEASNTELHSLCVDGGVTSNHFLMQFQANILGIEIKLPKTLETTALGAAYLAGLKVGFWNNLDEIVALKQYQDVFEPQFSKEDIDRRYNGWKKAVEATRVFKRETK